MPLWQLVVLALVQGVTEFLPISSSAHLIVIPQVAGAADQGLLIDVALHVSTLGAVVVFFRRDVGAAARGTAAVLRGRFDAPDARLALALGFKYRTANDLAENATIDELVRRIEAINRTSREIVVADLSQRIPVAAANDELDLIKTAQKELNAYTEQMICACAAAPNPVAVPLGR